MVCSFKLKKKKIKIKRVAMHYFFFSFGNLCTICSVKVKIERKEIRVIDWRHLRYLKFRACSQWAGLNGIDLILVIAKMTVKVNHMNKRALCLPRVAFVQTEAMMGSWFRIYLFFFIFSDGLLSAGGVPIYTKRDLGLLIDFVRENYP